MEESPPAWGGVQTLEKWISGSGGRPRPKMSLYGDSGGTDFRRTWWDVTASCVRVFATISTANEAISDCWQ